MSARRATAALAILVLMLVAAQYLGVEIAHYYGNRLSGEASSYGQWTDYQAHPPDVLLIGDSRVREDINVAAVQSALDSDLGRNVSVGKLGFDSAQPRNLLAMMYRVTHLARRPKLILYGLSEYQFANSFNFDPTYDFWNMELPLDAGYYQLTYEIDTGNQQRLLTGYVIPLDANVKVLETGVPCTEHDLKRLLAQNTPIKLNGALEPIGYCDTTPGFSQITMTPQSRDAVFEQYRTIFANNFSFSATEASYVTRAATMARSAGSKLAFFVSPEYHIEDLNPTAYAEFEDGTKELTSELGAQWYDFHAEFRDSPELFSDPAHLNALGAAAYLPQVVSLIEAQLPQS